MYTKGPECVVITVSEATLWSQILSAPKGQSEAGNGFGGTNSNVNGQESAVYRGPPSGTTGNHRRNTTQFGDTPFD